MPHYGKLVRDAIYQDETGAKFLMFGHIIHSETHEQYILLTAASCRENPFAVPLNKFLSQQPIMYKFLHDVNLLQGLEVYLQKNIGHGTYEHYKSTPEHKKMYNVLGSVTIQNGEELAIYYPLYGQQTLMGRPLLPINPNNQNEGAFDQQVNVPELNYIGQRFTRKGELTE